MAYAQGDLHGQQDVPGDDLAAIAMPRRSDTRGSSGDVVAEIGALRSINAHLTRQVALLRQREAQAQRLADRDGLTGLYNRRCMFELLESAMAQAAQQQQRVGLLFIDLDGFKAINDHFGHAAGDELLTMVAGRIAARARHGDYVCRYGGDEFVMILPRARDLAAVHRVADAIRARVALPCRVDGVDLKLTAAVGVSMAPDHATTAAALMHLADESMYRAKGRAAEAESARHAAYPARRRDDRDAPHAPR